MIKLRTSVLVLLILPLLSSVSFSQSIMRSLKNKVKNEIKDAVIGDTDSESSSTSEDNTTPSSSSSSKPRNTTGGGLIISPPDVDQNISEAEAAYKAKNYSESKHAIQQAMVGVEMEMGQDVLKSLPESVEGLKKNPDGDKVTSTGMAMVGLAIERQYNGGNDQQLNLIIGNNSFFMAGVNAYFASGYTTSTEQNHKQIKLKGYKAVLEYDENSGYKLSVPIGQTSFFVLEGINFESENAIMAAANQFNLDEIKDKLGEK